MAQFVITLTSIEDIVSEFTGFMQKLIPTSIVPVIIQLCATVVLFIVVTKFAFQPVRKIINTRKEYIANQLKDAEEAKKNALAYEATSKAAIDEAKAASNKMINDTKAEIAASHDKAIEELNQEIKAKKIRAEEEIASEKKAALEEIRKQIIDVAFDASETILNREINKDDNSRLVEDFVKDVVN